MKKFKCLCPKDIQKEMKKQQYLHFVPIHCMTEKKEIADRRKSLSIYKAVHK